MQDKSFNNRLQDKHDDELMQMVIIRNDTLWFCSAIQELVMQLREWLRDSGISVSILTIFHFDHSIRLWPDSPPACYSVSAASLKKEGATAELRPVAIYGEAGARGIARLRVAGTGDSWYRKDFLLFLSRETSLWTIRHEDDTPHAAVPLCPNYVISAISRCSTLKKRRAGG